MYRNQISAHNSRMLRKEQLMFLNKACADKDEKFQDLIDYLCGTLPDEDLIAMNNHFQAEWEMPEESIMEGPASTSLKRQKKGEEHSADLVPPFLKKTRSSTLRSGKNRD